MMTYRDHVHKHDGRWLVAHYDTRRQSWQCWDHDSEGTYVAPSLRALAGPPIRRHKRRSDALRSARAIYGGMSDSEIRATLGHNGAECRVVIHRDGRVSRYGSPDPTDRSSDYWQDFGRVEDYT